MDMDNIRGRKAKMIQVFLGALFFLVPLWSYGGPSENIWIEETQDYCESGLITKPKISSLKEARLPIASRLPASNPQLRNFRPTPSFSVHFCDTTLRKRRGERVHLEGVLAAQRLVFPTFTSSTPKPLNTDNVRLISLF